MPSSRNNLSLIVLWFLIAWFTIYPVTKKWNNPISWDAFGYYLYLPATFIWNDPALKDFSPVEKINSQYKNTPTYYQGGKTSTGNWMIKYTMGIALLEAPFYFVADLTASSFDYEADGFSEPYQKSVLIAHFFFLILGFVFLRKALLYLFDDKTVALLLMLLLLGTNYTITAMLTPGMPHIPEFALFAIILYLTMLWHEKSSKKIAAILGVTIGLAVLVRPTDIVVVLLPLLWNVSSLNSLKNKGRFILSNYKFDVLIFVFFSSSLIFLQLLYWKLAAGKWLLMSYSNNPGEGFEFFSPYIFKVLFSFRKGWLVYTPLMFFALTGFWWLYRNNKKIFWPITLFFIFNIYIVSSWSCWWYADSFGQRALVDSYSIMMIPLGYFLKSLNVASRLIKQVIGGIIILLIFLNIFQAVQYKNNIIDGSRMTAEYYLRIFGKTSVDDADRKLLLINRSRGEKEIFPDEDKYESKGLFTENFEQATQHEKTRVDSIAHNGKFSLVLDSLFSQKNKYELSYKDITKKDHAWIRASFWFYTPKQEDSIMQFVITFINYKNWPYKHTPVVIRKEEFKAGQWNNFTFDYLTPEVRCAEDKINIYFWPYGTTPIFLDDIQIEAFEKKDE
jgi:hypothetical protein